MYREHLSGLRHWEVSRVQGMLLRRGWLLVKSQQQREKNETKAFSDSGRSTHRSRGHLLDSIADNTNTAPFVPSHGGSEQSKESQSVSEYMHICPSRP